MPARSISTLCIRITNVNQKERFILLLSLRKGRYVGNANVKNSGGKACIKEANILSVPVEIETPTVIIEDFEQIAINNYKTTIFRNKYESNNPEELIDKFIFTSETEETLSQLYNISGEDRINKITELISLDHLDHLNQKELDHVKKINC